MTDDLRARVEKLRKEMEPTVKDDLYRLIENLVGENDSEISGSKKQTKNWIEIPVDKEKL